MEESLTTWEVADPVVVEFDRKTSAAPSRTSAERAYFQYYKCTIQTPQELTVLRNDQHRTLMPTEKKSVWYNFIKL